MTIFLESFSWSPSPPAWCFPGSWAWFISFSLGGPCFIFPCCVVEEADFLSGKSLQKVVSVSVVSHELVSFSFPAVCMDNSLRLSCCFGLEAPSWNVACEVCTSLGLLRTLASSFSPFFFFVASKNERLFSFWLSSVVCPEYMLSSSRSPVSAGPILFLDTVDSFGDVCWRSWGAHVGWPTWLQNVKGWFSITTCYDYSKSIGYDKNLLSQKSAIPLFLRSLLCRCPGAHHETWE